MLGRGGERGRHSWVERNSGRGKRVVLGVFVRATRWRSRQSAAVRDLGNECPGVDLVTRAALGDDQPVAEDAVVGGNDPGKRGRGSPRKNARGGGRTRGGRSRASQDRSAAHG
ncbi:hypothetical protein KM043_006704 [Ampulex compressa]|nr:hypothetical protein KM043_006704 [Ampulex compressa]